VRAGPPIQAPRSRHRGPASARRSPDRSQASRLAELRASREAGAVERALSALRKAAEGTDNVLPPMKEALKARATVGEVCDALREVWGTYQPVERF